MAFYKLNLFSVSQQYSFKIDGYPQENRFRILIRYRFLEDKAAARSHYVEEIRFYTIHKIDVSENLAEGDFFQILQDHLDARNRFVIDLYSTTEILMCQMLTKGYIIVISW
jgi:hypothetical protein